MTGALVGIAAAMFGIDVGWQPLPDGGMEYIIQIEPQTLRSLEAGEDFYSDVPPQVRNVRSYRITVGTEQLPRILPGEAESPSNDDEASATLAVPERSAGPATPRPAAADPTAGRQNADSPFRRLSPNETDLRRPRSRFSRGAAEQDTAESAAGAQPNGDTATRPATDTRAGTGAATAADAGPGADTRSATDNRAAPSRSREPSPAGGSGTSSWEAPRGSTGRSTIPTPDDMSSLGADKEEPRRAAPPFRPSFGSSLEQPLDGGRRIPTFDRSNNRPSADDGRSASEANAQPPGSAARSGVPGRNVTSVPNTESNRSVEPSPQPQDDRDLKARPPSRFSRGPIPQTLDNTETSKPLAERQAVFVEASESRPDDQGGKAAASPGDEAEEEPKPWTPLIATVVALFGSLGLNVYMGWITWDTRTRYRQLVDRYFSGTTWSSESEVGEQLGPAGAGEVPYDADDSFR